MMTDKEKLALVADHEEWLWVRWKALAGGNVVMGITLPATTTECLVAIERCQRIRTTLIIPKYGPV